MDIYREAILDHSKHPRNEGELTDPDAKAHGANPLCGDAVAITVKLSDGKIADIKFRGEGCAVSQASASMLTEKVKGMDVSEVEKIDKEAVKEYMQVDLSASRMKCAMLPVDVLRKAFSDSTQ